MRFIESDKRPSESGKEEEREMVGKRGFTLVEILIAGIVFAILGMATGSLFYLHGKMIKNVTEKTQKSLNAQYALSHIVENVASSAFVTVLDVNTIELHSHSNPNIRKYYFSNGSLRYQAGASSVILAQNIDATMPFLGAGTEKQVNRFRKVKIEFWDKGDTNISHRDKDVFYAQAYAESKEDWNIIYVDSTSISSGQDGTKVFPFLTLGAALEIATEDDVIVALAGSYELSDEVNVLCGHLYLGPDTSLTINAGSTLKMGKNTTVLTEGIFSCTGGPGNVIKITSADPQSHTWGGITIRPVAENSNAQKYFNFSYLDLSYASSAITVDPKEDNIAISVDISNNSAYNNSTVYSISGASEFHAFNNTFTNNYTSLSLKNDSSFAYQGTIKQYVYQNTFNGKTGLQYDSGVSFNCCANSSHPIVQEIYNNDFPEVQTAINLNNSGDGIITSKVYNNKMYPEQYSAVNIMSNSNTNTSSTLDISNNIIDANKRQNSYGGCLYLGNNKPFAITVSNNDIRNSRNYSYAYGIEVVSIRNVTIKNNLIHNIQCWGIWVEPHYSNMDMLIKNNIMYGTSGSCSIFLWPTGSYYANMTLINNTLSGTGTLYGSARWIVKNSILWGNAKMESYVQQKTTYSCVKNMSDAYVNETTKNIRTDPLLNTDYTLQSSSPCKAAAIVHGDNGKPLFDIAGNTISTEMGAFGGDYDPDIGIGPNTGIVGRTE